MLPPILFAREQSLGQARVLHFVAATPDRPREAVAGDAAPVEPHEPFRGRADQCAVAVEAKAELDTVRGLLRDAREEGPRVDRLRCSETNVTREHDLAHGAR